MSNDVREAAYRLAEEVREVLARVALTEPRKKKLEKALADYDKAEEAA